MFKHDFTRQQYKGISRAKEAAIFFLQEPGISKRLPNLIVLQNNKYNNESISMFT